MVPQAIWILYQGTNWKLDGSSSNDLRKMPRKIQAHPSTEVLNASVVFPRHCERMGESVWYVDTCRQLTYTIVSLANI